MMISALIGAAVFLALYGGMRTVRSRRAERNHALLSSINPAERARILATPVEELADEIVWERERAAHVVRLPEAQASYAVAMATFVVQRFGVEQRPYGGPGRCALDVCSGPMFSSPTTRQSICGRCGRVVDWEEVRA